MFSRLRTFKRFGVFVFLSISVLTGLGLDWLRERIGRRAWAFAVPVMLILILFEIYPGRYQNFAVVEARPVDYWLAEQPGDGAVAQFPFYQVQDQDQVYNTLIHGKPFIGGFFNAFPPKQYQYIRPLMESFPDEESIGLLFDLSIHYVVVDVNEYENFGEVKSTLEHYGISFIGAHNGDAVFQLPKR